MPPAPWAPPHRACPARLDAVRKAANALRESPQLKREVFTRGDPQAVKAGSQMPNLGLSDDQIDALTEYLYTLE